VINRRTSPTPADDENGGERGFNRGGGERRVRWNENTKTESKAFNENRAEEKLIEISANIDRLRKCVANQVASGNFLRSSLRNHRRQGGIT